MPATRACRSAGCGAEDKGRIDVTEVQHELIVLVRLSFPLLPTRARATASCDGRGCSSSSGLHRNPLLMHHQWEDVVLVGFSSVDESDIAYCMDLATECC